MATLSFELLLEVVGHVQTPRPITAAALRKIEEPIKLWWPFRSRRFLRALKGRIQKLGPFPHDTWSSIEMGCHVTTDPALHYAGGVLRTCGTSILLTSGLGVSVAAHTTFNPYSQGTAPQTAKSILTEAVRQTLLEHPLIATKRKLLSIGVIPIEPPTYQVYGPTFLASGA